MPFAPETMTTDASSANSCRSRKARNASTTSRPKQFLDSISYGHPMPERLNNSRRDRAIHAMLNECLGEHLQRFVGGGRILECDRCEEGIQCQADARQCG